MFLATNDTTEPNIFDFGNTIFEDGLLTSLIVITVLALIFYLCYTFINRFMQKRELVNAKSIANITRGILIMIWVLIVFSRFVMFAPIAKGILASSSIIALIVGIAAQDTLGNLFSGIMVIISKPFVVGDLIKINQDQLIGYVEQITLRHTIIRTYENNRIIIPNNAINQAVVENANFVTSVKSNYFEVVVTFDSDIDVAVQLMKEVCLQHPKFIDNRSHAEIQANISPVNISCTRFADTGMVLRAEVFSEDSISGFHILSDLRFALKKEFDAHGVQFAYNHTFTNPKEK
ncbi:mechanosensitive ion channel-like protein [Breznakia blatticola]|uniref:Mechanosensitive ion channel-like protein n=1 Tax=Breznakia blatticola TaxID=1754012 RepID=A0A4R8A5R8_9FIRM|nr:mechanosensitive ion channel family protein [Breznakia blatticola]TDW25722.1 mechanosensitive ion channel-like protein [Breznakia blatticola]